MNIRTVEWQRLVLFELRPNLALHLERSPQCTVSPLEVISANRWPVRCKARWRSNGRSLSSQRNAADGRSAARPQGALRTRHDRVAALANGTNHCLRTASCLDAFGRALKVPPRVKQHTHHSYGYASAGDRLTCLARIALPLEPFMKNAG